MDVFLFFLLSIVQAKRTTPIISLFCHYPDDSFSEQCKNLKKQFMDSDTLIQKYQILLTNTTAAIENLTTKNEVNLLKKLQKRQIVLERIINILNDMESPQSSKYPNKIAEISKKSEILYIIQGGSTPINHPYDFKYLKSKMIVDIFQINTVPFNFETFVLSAAFINLKNTTKSVLSFHKFNDFLSMHTNPKLNSNEENVFNEMEQRYQAYAKSFDKSISEMENHRHISYILDKFSVVRIKGEHGGNLLFLTVSNCILSIDSTPLKIENIGLLDNVYFLSGSQSISSKYVIISSLTYLYQSRNAQNSKFTSRVLDDKSDLNSSILYKFDRLALWSDLNTMMPCRMGIGSAGIRITFGSYDSNECVMTEHYKEASTDVFVPFSIVKKQISFIFPFNDSIEMRVLSVDEENGFYTPDPTNTPLPTETEVYIPTLPDPPPPPDWDTIDVSILRPEHEKSKARKMALNRYFQSDDNSFFSVSQEINLSIQLKSFLNPFLEGNLTDADDESDDPIYYRNKRTNEESTPLKIYFTGYWNRVTEPLKLLIESYDSPIEYIDLPDKVITSKSYPYTYTVVDKGKLNIAAIVGVAVGCTAILVIVTFVFVYCFSIKKKPIGNQVYN